MPDHPTVDAVSVGPPAGHASTFDFKTVLLHHNLPYPAWEPFPGRPWLVFDLGRYAAIHYPELSRNPGLVEVDGAPYGTWAETITNTGDFRYDHRTLEAGTLSRCMALVARDRAGLVFPRPLSFLNHQTFFGLLFLVIVTLLLGLGCRRRPDQVLPRNRFQGAMEALVLYLRDDLVRPALPEHADRWAPYLIGMFILILTVNLCGLIPGTGTMSGNLGVTAGFAALSLGMMVVGGMVEQGPLRYWLNLVPIPFTLLTSPLWLLLLVIELLGLVIKPVALAVRLFANMFAGHTTLLVLLSLGYIVLAANPASVAMASGLSVLGVVFAALMHFLELLVAVIQAYVFTLLSAMFIGMSLRPAHA